MKIFFAISEGCVAQIKSNSVGDLFISPYHSKFDFDASVSKLYTVIIKYNQSKDIHVSTVFMFMRGSLCKGRVSKELVIINH